MDQKPRADLAVDDAALLSEPYRGLFGKSGRLAVALQQVQIARPEVLRIATGDGFDKDSLGAALKTGGRAQTVGSSTIEFEDVVSVVVAAHGGTRFAEGSMSVCDGSRFQSRGWKGCSRNFSRH